jgi:putative ABC transport system permease protein
LAGRSVLRGGGAALAGALSAVHRAVSLPPAEAMRPESPTRFRPGLARRLGIERFLPLSVRIVLRNLERQPLKALLSTLGLALAVSIVVTGFYAFDAVDWMRNVQFGRIQREDVTVVFRDPLAGAPCHELAGLPGVLRVEPFRSVAVRLRHGPREERTAILAMDRSAELRKIVDAGLRTHELPLEGLLLTSMLAGKLGVGPGDAVTVEVLEGRRPVREVEVAGLVDEMVGTAVYMERGELGRLLGEGPAVSGAWLAVDPAASETLYARLKRLPAVSGVAVKRVTLEGFDRTIAESFRLSLFTVIGFACVIAFGVVYNGARIGLSERGRELASLRILGFSRREVESMLLGEQTLLTLLSLPLGFAIGYGLCALMAWRFESELFRLPLVISGSTYLLAVGVVGAAAVLSGLAVRRRLDRMDLVSVLKTRE